MERTPITAKRRWYRSDWVVIPCMLTMLLAARSSLADHYHVPSGSMEYTIMPGDRVLIDKTAYGLRVPFTGIEVIPGSGPARGDIAVFDSPDDGTRLIKRITAVAGDTVTLDAGLLVINGERLTEAPVTGARTDTVVEIFGKHRALLNLNTGGGPTIGPITIPAGFVLVLGDHRGNSRDSRYFGLIAADRVYGRALGVYYRRGEGLDWRPL